ncbi:hypothetical protein AVEN_96190-1 [Araneus ventricosus]|uniref:Uncharacterized protein n=1 Tax=Araneus ventricosus TaxID=182803 RepID=A0A4Y2FT29_ARAVE|nr:hypothetical protein AVEN_96190-1 [Araneus ventricosus]
MVRTLFLAIFNLFRKLKEFLGGKRFGSDEELENAVATCLNELAAEEYEMEILKLVDRYDKCLNVGASSDKSVFKRLCYPSRNQSGLLIEKYRFETPHIKYSVRGSQPVVIQVSL